ncbi:uncharacterized protein LOC123543139 [Mercenaria mercenaria]|uniref:uncharacterized protein LOC123543139 n=1 Tax=Mercenaria mercenaria TaxID=6596 RepID=UPI001E1DF93B|nr:uncharacterized protein LOC123543139 [Mercenaria mercenaria]
MKVLSGYILVTMIGLAASQGISDSRLFSLLQGPSRRIQLRRNSVFDTPRVRQQYNLGIHDADHVNIVPTARASATASSSAGIRRSLGGLAGIRLNDLLGGSGLLAGHIGIQPQALPNVAVRRSSTIVRPRRTFVLGQGVHSGAVAVPSQIATSGLPAGSSTMMFDTPDPNTPDTPDLVYAPRSMMGNMHEIEALRNRAEADGVVFV